MRARWVAVTATTVSTCLCVGVLVLAPVLRHHVPASFSDIGLLSWIAAGVGGVCVAAVGLLGRRDRSDAGSVMVPEARTPTEAPQHIAPVAARRETSIVE